MRRLAAVIATAALMLTVVPAGAETPAEQEDRRICVYHRPMNFEQCIVIEPQSLGL